MKKYTYDRYMMNPVDRLMKDASQEFSWEDICVALMREGFDIGIDPLFQSIDAKEDAFYHDTTSRIFSAIEALEQEKLDQERGNRIANSLHSALAVE